MASNEAPAPRTLTPKMRPLLLGVLLLVAGVVFYSHARLYWELTEDDAFISWRYAENLAAGEGLVFNEGERVEGYSNYLWVVISAVGIRAGIDPILVSKVIGVLCGFLCLLLSWLLARRMLPRSGLLTLLAPFYLALSPVLVHHCSSGLESGFFAFLVLSSILLTLSPHSRSAQASLAQPALAEPNSLQPGEKRDSMPMASLGNRALFALSLTAMSMTRPEGPALAIVLLLCRVWCKRSLRRALPEIILFTILFGGYFVWRWAYFGSLFPNTYYAKTSGGLHGVIDGVQYSLDFMRDSGGIFFMALSCVPLLMWRARPAYGITLLVLATYVAFVVLSGGDWMYNYRFYSHVMPLLGALIASGFEVLLSLPAAKSMRAIGVYALTAVLLLATFMSIGNTELAVARNLLPAVKMHNYLSQNYQELGEWLEENSEPGATIAISDVGAVGYYSKRPILDMFGLVDSHIARLKGRMHYKADPKYVLSREPEFIVLISTGDPAAGLAFQRVPDFTLHALPEFQERYELIRSVPQNWNNEHALIFRRRNS